MHLDLWDFIIIIVLIGAISKTVRSFALISRGQGRSSRERDAAILERLDKLEKRMANLETIVLEAEKHKQFDQAL